MLAAETCSSAADKEAQQLASSTPKKDIIILYTYIMISDSFRRKHSKPYSSIDLASLMQEQGKKLFRFYKSQQLAEDGVRARSWYKRSKEYLIVSYKVSDTVLESTETSEKKLSTALNASKVPFRMLKKGHNFSVLPQHLKAVLHVKAEDSYERTVIPLPETNK